MTLHVDAEYLKLQMDTISLCDCPTCNSPGCKLFTPIAVNGQAIEFAMTCAACNAKSFVTCDLALPDGEKITGGD